MSFEEEFDKIIRRKAEEENYPFDQSNWDKANDLLEADRMALRATKLKKFYLPVVLTVVLGSSLFIAFNYLNSTETDKEKIVATSESPVVGEKVNEAEDLPAQINSIKNEPVEITSAGEINSTLSKSNTTHVSEGIVEPADLSAAINLKGIPDNSSAKSLEEKGIVTKNPVPVNKNESAENNGPEFPATNESASINKATGENQAEKDALSSAGSTSQDSYRANSKNDPEQNYTSESDLQYQIPLNNTEETALNAEQLSAVYSTLPFEMAELDLMKTSFTYLSRYDDDYYKNGKMPKTHYMNVEVGGNYLLGWNAQKGNDGKGLNWFGGVNYGRYFSDKISLSFGIQAYNIAHITQPFYLVASKDYGFGSKNIYTRVTSHQLYYVAVPLKFNYALNAANIIGFGINAGYLVSANNTVSKYYILDNEERSIGSSESHNQGIYKGTNTLNMMLSAHYRTQFGKRIGMNLEFNYGLTDIFKNTEAIKTLEKPMGVRLSLTYTLFDK